MSSISISIEIEEYYLLDKFQKSELLMRLCEKHENDTFKKLFDLNDEGTNFLAKAIKENNVELLSYLFDQGFNISNEQAISASCNNCLDILMIKILLERGIDLVLTMDLIAFHAEHGSDEIFEFLLKHGANPNGLIIGHFHFRRLIEIAIYHNDVFSCEILLSYGVDLSLDNYNCLSLAIRSSSNEKIIKLLLDNGANPLVITKDDLGSLVKSTPSLSLINFLIGYGIDLSVINSLEFKSSRLTDTYPKLLELGIDPIVLIKLYEGR